MVPGVDAAASPGWSVIEPALGETVAIENFRAVFAHAAGGWSARSEAPPLAHVDLWALSKHRVLTSFPFGSIGDATQREQFLDRFAVVQGVQLRIESAAIAALSALDDAGVPTRVIKGMASAELDYPWPELRHAGDIDLVVPPECLDLAIDTLRAQHWRLLYPRQPIMPLLRDNTFISPTGVDLDLHTRPLHRRQRGRTDLVFADDGEPLANLPSRAMSAPHRLVLAAAHFLITPPGKRRASGLCDVIAILHRHSIDWPEARRVADVWRCERLVGGVLALIDELGFGPPGLTEVRRLWPQPDALERAAFLGSNSSRPLRVWWNSGLRTPIRIWGRTKSMSTKAPPVFVEDDRGMPAAPVDDDAVLTRVAAVGHRSLPDGSMVLYEPTQDRCLRLNPTSVLIWEALGDGALANEVVATCAARTGERVERVAGDALPVLGELVAAGFVEAP